MKQYIKPEIELENLELDAYLIDLSKGEGPGNGIMDSKERGPVDSDFGFSEDFDKF